MSLLNRAKHAATQFKADWEAADKRCDEINAEQAKKQQSARALTDQQRQQVANDAVSTANALNVINGQ